MKNLLIKKLSQIYPSDSKQKTQGMWGLIDNNYFKNTFLF
tara:strand:- start:1146 stop:1265 length:120 start_codon:yes stop_codon:yes gene_type:complete